MPNINRPASKHKTGITTKDGDFWEPFTKDAHITIMINAFMMIHRRIIANKNVKKTCNAAFCKLPGGRSFEAVWRDPGIWVSFDPTSKTGFFAITFKKDIAIPSWVFEVPNAVGAIAATLVHELAHVNGAPGDDKQAESMLPPCGFEDMFKPGTIGAVRRPTQVYLA
jgi:hypothetical protein